MLLSDLLAAVEHGAGRSDGVVAGDRAEPAVLQLQDGLRPDAGERASRARRDLVGHVMVSFVVINNQDKISKKSHSVVLLLLTLHNFNNHPHK